MSNLKDLREVLDVFAQLKKNAKKTTTVTEEFGDYNFQNLENRFKETFERIVETIETNMTNEPLAATESEKSTFEYTIKDREKSIEDLKKTIDELKKTISTERALHAIQVGGSVPVDIKIPDEPKTPKDKQKDKIPF